MNSIKICNALKNFSPAQEKEFLKFASSSIAVKRNLHSFAKALIKIIKANSEASTSRGYLNLITQKLKLKRPVATARLSELSKVYDYFTLISYFRAEVMKKNFLLLESALLKNNFEMFDEVFNKLERVLKNNKLNFSYCDNMYKFYEAGSYRNFIENKHDISGSMFKKKAEYKTADFIFDYFITEIEMIQKTLIYKSSEDPYVYYRNKIEIKDIIKSLKDTDQRLYFLLLELHTCYLTFLNPDIKKFYDELKALHNRFKNHYDESLREYFFRIMINHCINRINTGDRKFLK